MTEITELINEEKIAPSINGMIMLILDVLLCIAAAAAIILSAVAFEAGNANPLNVSLFVAGVFWLALPAWLIFAGLKVVQPNEAYVFTLFGKYHGTLKKDGFYYVNPFVSALNPMRNAAIVEATTAAASGAQTKSEGSEQQTKTTSTNRTKRISLKAMTLNNNKQKINDQLGNPIEIGIVVIWKVVNTAKAVFNVDNYYEYLSLQTDSALRNIVRLYPYDLPGDEAGEMSLRGSSQEISARICEAIQEKVEIAGLEVVEARITHLAYAPEIAAAMLRRQQASAIVDARALIVQGAVEMVHHALDELDKTQVISLDEERKAAMVSNLLVVLCGQHDAQPIVNSGSLY